MCVRCDAQMYFNPEKAVKKFLDLSKTLKKSLLLTENHPNLNYRKGKEEGVYYSVVDISHLPDVEGGGKHPLEMGEEEINGEYEGVMRDAWGERGNEEEVRVGVKVVGGQKKYSIFSAPNVQLRVEILERKGVRKR